MSGLNKIAVEVLKLTTPLSLASQLEQYRPTPSKANLLPKQKTYPEWVYPISIAAITSFVICLVCKMVNKKTGSK